MVKIFRVPMLLQSLAMLAACGLTPDEKVHRAEQRFAEHQFTSARFDLIAALQDQPGNHRATELLARTQLELGDGEAAATTLTRLAAGGALPPDGAILRGEADLLRGRLHEAIDAVAGEVTPDAWRVRALAYIKLGDIPAATEAFGKGTEAEGPKARLLAENARFALARGQLATARQLAKAAMVADPAVLEVQLASAQIAAAEGRLGDALAAYAAASHAYPESRSALIGRIATLGDLGRTNEMEPLLRNLTERAPDDIAVIYLRARLAAAKGDWETTRKSLQAIEAQMNDMPQSRLLYGQALTELGQQEQAIAILRSYVRSNPGHRLARRLLARAQLAAGDAAGAEATIRPLAARPEASPAELALMAAASRAARSADAAAFAERSRFPAPEMLASELALADDAMKRRDWRGAARAYRRILAATDGRNVLVLNNLAFVEGQLGNRAAALKLAQQALAQAPNNPSVLDTAGWLMIQSGDRDGGLALLRKAAKLAPNNPAIARHLAEAARG